jgi:hypothetical protein
MKANNTLRIIEVSFQLIGIGCLLGCVLSMFNTFNFLKGAERVEGIVVENIVSRDSDGSETYRALVKYSKTGGETGRFKASVASNPPSFDVGEHVNVLVSMDGSKQKIDSFTQIWFLPLFLVGFGAIFGGIGFSFPILRKRRATFAKYIKEMGDKLETEDVEVLVNSAYSVNNRNPFYLQCKANIDGVETVFKSENIWDNPSKALGGRKVSIYYLRNEPKRHLVDIEFLNFQSKKR